MNNLAGMWSLTIESGRLILLIFQSFGRSSAITDESCALCAFSLFSKVESSVQTQEVPQQSVCEETFWFCVFSLSFPLIFFMP